MIVVENNRAGRCVRIIIPFYRSPGLVAPLFRSLLDCADELNQLRCTVIAINDSPDDVTLDRILKEYVHRLSQVASCILKTNEANRGFVKTVNAELAEGLHENCDFILLNSDTVVFPGAFREMVRVAQLDPMIAFVSPRSNNATICTFPQHRELQHSSPTYFHQAFTELCNLLPEFHYVPTAVGFCLFIKGTIIKELGLLDEVYGKGYNEENDLIMRANRLGFRAVLANRAFVHHLGEQSFSVSDSPKSVHDEKNAALLKNRYPEYFEHIQAYFSGPLYEGERLVSGFLTDSDGRLDILFDCSYFGPYHNGTFDSARRILKEASNEWRDRFNIFVMASAAAAAFHELGSLPGVMIVPVDTTRVFAAAFRFGQPFHLDAVLRMSRLAPVNVYAMLDTIAWDCLYLNRDDLDMLWRTVAQYADGLLYISDFNRDQFRRRFSVRPGMPEQVAYLSLTPSEYRPPQHDATSYSGSHLLVVGNSFAHKYVGPTVSSLSASFPRTKIVALGLDRQSGQNVTAYPSGDLTEDRIADLYANARAVVFPSTYEGFGIPTIEALAHRKVIFVRDTPLNRALRQKLDSTRNIVLYDCTKSLIEMLAAPGAFEWNDDGCTGCQYSWADHTSDLRRLMQAAVDNFSWERTLLPRLYYMRLLDTLANRAVSGRAGGNDEDAQNAVVECARFENKGIDPQTLERALEPILHEVRSLGLRFDNAMSDPGIRTSHAEELSATVEALTTALKDRDVRIQELLNSRSWSITAPLRSVGKHFMKSRLP